MANMCTLGEMKSGRITLDDVLKMNSLLDMKDALLKREHDKARTRE